MMRFAGYTRPKITKQIERAAADILQRNIALQGRVELVPLQDIAEIADAGGR